METPDVDTAGADILETLLLSNAESLRITSCPLPAPVPPPLLFRWHSDTAPEVPDNERLHGSK